MKIYKLLPHGFAANTYLLTENGRDAIAVDPAQETVAGEAARRGLTVKTVLLTHGHFDHIGGCAVLQKIGAKIGCLAGEEKLALGEGNAAAYFGYPPVQPFKVDFTFRGGEKLLLSGIGVDVIATPGHTSGGAVFMIGEHLFTGDTLFYHSAGRTDLPTGSGAALRSSLKTLFALKGDFAVHPGHGEDTALSDERAYFEGI